MPERPVRRTALVTGGGRGLGRVIALALFDAGHDVVISATERASLDSVVAERTGGPQRMLAIAADLAVQGEAERLAGAAVDALGGIDILVNNAGLGLGSLRPNYAEHGLSLWDAGRHDIERFYAVNTIAPMVLAGRLAPAMIARGWGRIICVTTSLDTMLKQSLYGGSKAALEAETAALAGQLVGTGVTANVLIPGGATGSRMSDLIGLPRDRIFPDTIMRAPVRFLASPDSDGFTAGRLIACRWRAEMPAAEAARAASDVIAWTGFGAQGVQPPLLS
jgi:NAD(P)-dependent dehydrogenase (short-subunit alcohol dehydrogenase family)